MMLSLGILVMMMFIIPINGKHPQTNKYCVPSAMAIGLIMMMCKIPIIKYGDCDAHDPYKEIKFGDDDAHSP